MSENKNYFNNTKVANCIRKFDDLSRKYDVSELGDKHKGINSYIVFPAKGVQHLNYSLNRFDLAVMDAIYTLYKRGKDKFTPEMIADTIFGKEVKYSKESTSKLDQISDAINKLACIRVEINFKDVMMTIDPSLRLKIQAGEKSENEYIIRDQLLEIREITIKSKIKKEKKTLYLLKGKPILYEYAEQLGRIISVPTEVLVLPGVREDLDFALVKQEVVKEIELMKNANNRYATRTITYEWEHGEKSGGLLYRLGIDKNKYKNDVQWRKRKSRLNEQIKIILDHLVEMDYIKGYDFNYKGKAIVGFNIEL